MKIRVALDKAMQDRQDAESKSQVNWLNTSATDYAPVHRSAHVPLDTARARDHRTLVGAPGVMAQNAYKVLRAKIALRMQEQHFKTVLITSSNPGEGKTLTAVNLALTCAGAFDQTVLLVDCNLRRPDVCRTLGVETRAGLGDYLIDHVPLHEVMTWPGVEKLTLISGGAPVDKSAEVLGSQRMQMLMKELKSRYDNRLILFDAPDLLSCADTLAMLPLVDSIVLIVSEGQTRLRDLRKALDGVPEEKILGVVLNRRK